MLYRGDDPISGPLYQKPPRLWSRLKFWRTTGETISSSLAVIQRPLVVRHFDELPVPPVIAYFKKHRRLPDYILDETHLCFDSQGEYVGYVDREGKRRNEWNEYESIRMAERRESKEVIRKVLWESRRRDEVDDEHPPRKLTGEQKLEMLRKGACSEAQAERWSARTGVPPYVYLEKDDFARAELFKQWKTARDGEKK